MVYAKYKQRRQKLNKKWNTKEQKKKKMLRFPPIIRYNIWNILKYPGTLPYTASNKQVLFNIDYNCMFFLLISKQKVAFRDFRILSHK